MFKLVLAAGIAAAVTGAHAEQEMTVFDLCLECKSGGYLRGQAQNGSIVNEEFAGGKMCVDTISHGDQNGPYINFTRDGQPWPPRPWGVRADSWRLTCAK